MTKTLFFVRHGRTAWNAAGRYLGSSEIELDDVGREQAEHLGRWASDTAIKVIFSSPARRALTTANTIGRWCQAQVRVDERLRELDFGIAEGRTMAELRQAEPDAVKRFESDPARYSFPGGEPPTAVVDRVDAVVGDALKEDDDRILFVCHNTLLRLYLCHRTGIPLSSYRRCLSAVDHRAYTELSHTDGGFRLERFNAPALASDASHHACAHTDDDMGSKR